MSAATPNPNPTFKIGSDEFSINPETIAAQEKRFFGPDSVKESIRERGVSYIEAAILIIKNSTLDDQKKGLEILNLQDIQNDWKEDKEIDTNKLHELVNHLCNKIKPHVNPKANLNNKSDLDKVLKSLNNAENHVNWKKRDPLKTVVQLDDDTVQVRIDTPITEFTKKQEKEWLKILNDNEKDRPKWFNKLEKWEQRHFMEIVNKWNRLADPKENLGTYMGVPPTTIRGYPGARNAYQSDIYTFKRNPNPPNEFLPKPVSHVTKVRSGHISPSKMKSKKERRAVAQENLEQLILAGIRNDIANNPGKSNFLVDFQTLISPPLMPADIHMDSDRLHATKNLRTKFEGKKFDTFLKENGIEIKEIPTITLVTSNYPVNKARALASLFTGIRGRAENNNTLKVLNKAAAELLTGHKKLTPDQKMAIDALQKIKEISGPLNRVRNFFRRGINHNAERAALEQIAVSGLGGIRIGSCMSGKDREEAVTQHVAAISAFYTKYGSLPPIPPSSNLKNKKYSAEFIKNLNKDLRDEYENMVAKEFLSCHGQQIAEANAKGARGMKSAAVILGGNVSKKVKDITLKSHEKDSEENKAHWENANPTKNSHLIAKLNRLEAAAVKGKKQNRSDPDQKPITWAPKKAAQKLKAALSSPKKMKDEEYIELLKDPKNLDKVRELCTKSLENIKDSSILLAYCNENEKNIFNSTVPIATTIQRAYPKPEFDENGKLKENRKESDAQTCINVVNKFTNAIRDKETRNIPLTPDEKKAFFAASVYVNLSAIETRLSQHEKEKNQDIKVMHSEVLSMECSALLEKLKGQSDILEGITKPKSSTKPSNF